jgi:hypothetical protein
VVQTGGGAGQRFRGLTRLDHEEGGTTRTFFDDGFAFRETALLERARAPIPLI